MTEYREYNVGDKVKFVQSMDNAFGAVGEGAVKHLLGNVVTIKAKLSYEPKSPNDRKHWLYRLREDNEGYAWDYTNLAPLETEADFDIEDDEILSILALS